MIGESGKLDGAWTKNPPNRQRTIVYASAMRIWNSLRVFWELTENIPFLSINKTSISWPIPITLSSLHQNHDVLSLSITFYHFLSLSITFYHFLSLSIPFYHFFTLFLHIFWNLFEILQIQCHTIHYIILDPISPHPTRHYQLSHFSIITRHPLTLYFQLIT
jgi:hypothetical protein